MVEVMLSDEQYCVQTSKSVGDALGAIKEKHFDVYLIDYKLQDGNGLDVAKRIRAKGSAAPIILMSGYDSSAFALRAEELRITNFLQKPFSRETICNAVKEAISLPAGTTAFKPPVAEVKINNRPWFRRFNHVKQ
jgi:two-component system response regulator HydG